MCDRYSTVHGYLCEDCFTELVYLGLGTNVTTNVTTFMNTPPNHVVHTTAFNHFDDEFRPNNGEGE